ncbi:hypothetical protein LCGC14_2936770, partial [marine sediment metagenome]
MEEKPIWILEEEDKKEKALEVGDELLVLDESAPEGGEDITLLTEEESDRLAALNLDETLERERQKDSQEIEQWTKATDPSTTPLVRPSRQGLVLKGHT